MLQAGLLFTTINLVGCGVTVQIILSLNLVADTFISIGLLSRVSAYIVYGPGEVPEFNCNMYVPDTAKVMLFYINI